MSINCQKCLYHMTIVEALATLSAETCKALKDVIIPAIVAAYTKRGMSDIIESKTEEAIIGLLNSFEIKCHICMKFHAWSRNLVRASYVIEKNIFTDDYRK